MYGKPATNEPAPNVSDKEKKETGRFSKMHQASEKAKREKQVADKARRSSTFYKDTHPASAPKMKKANEEFENIEEKAPPGAKFERMVKHIKKGYAKDGGLTDKEKSIAYATAWKAKNKMSEAMDATTGVSKEPVKASKTQSTAQDAQRKQQVQQLRTMIMKKRQLQNQELALQKQGKLPVDTHATENFEMNGNSIEELNRYEKETGKSSGSLNMPKGRPTQKGGETDLALRAVRQTMRKMSGKPAGQQKKVPGKKPPKAGEYGAPASPAQKVAKRRAAAQRSQDMMHSRFD